MFKAIQNLSRCALMLCCSSLSACCPGAAGQQQTTKQPGNVTELLSCLDNVAANLQDYTVTGITESNGKKQQFKLIYKRPNLVRINTREGQVAVQPNGEIKGRLGHGPLGKIAQKLGRDDRRLKDVEGIPFYQSDFVSMLARVHEQIRGGAAAAMQIDPISYSLEISSGDIVWKYLLDRRDFSLKESSRWMKGKQVEITHYTAFHPNTGVAADLFKF